MTDEAKAGNVVEALARVMRDLPAIGKGGRASAQQGGYAYRGIEQITLDAGAGHLKDSIMPRYAELIYNGFWFSPEREMLQALIDKSQEHVTGTVRVKLYKGMARTVARWSDHSLYSEKHVTFEEDAGAYDQKDAAGFIRLNALRLKLIATRNARVKG